MIHALLRGRMVYPSPEKTHPRESGANVAEQNLSESVYVSLSERILRWDFLPGHRFTEEALCEEFGVSRSPVREALHKLAEAGLIEKRPKLGYSVRLLDFKEIDELYDVRIALEDFVIEWLCRRGIEPKRLDELIEYWAGLPEGLPGNVATIPAADEKFHETLCGLIGNMALSKALKDIDRRIHFVRLADIRTKERAVATCLEHMELLKAIRDRNVDRALDVLRRNIEDGRSSVESAIKEALAHAYHNRD
jgi:DNA-binding GntR family transcriptional regulator